MEEELTAEEHEYLTTFVFQNRPRDRALPTDHPAPLPKPVPPKNDDSPLNHIREDVFRDVKRTIKRIATLNPDSPAFEQPRLAFTAITRKKIRPRDNFLTIFAQQENRVPCSPADHTRREDAKEFRPCPPKRTKMLESRSCDRILRDRKVLQVYNNNFLREVFAPDEQAFPDEFSERYLMTAPQPEQKAPLYARLRAKQ